MLCNQSLTNQIALKVMVWAIFFCPQPIVEAFRHFLKTRSKMLCFIICIMSRKKVDMGLIGVVVMTTLDDNERLIGVMVVVENVRHGFDKSVCENVRHGFDKSVC
jgi:hypothetical protein